MPNQRNLKDALTKITTALPVSGITAASAVITLPTSTRGDFLAPVDVVVTAPALTTTQLPDAKSVAYTIETDDNSGFSSATVLLTIGTQTGAGGAGAATAEYRCRLPLAVEPYIRVKASPSATQSADCSAASMILELRY